MGITVVSLGDKPDGFLFLDIADFTHIGFVSVFSWVKVIDYWVGAADTELSCDVRVVKF